MKARMRIVFLVLATSILIAPPALLYAGETPGGNIWDEFVDKSPFTGTKLTGTLSIYYELGEECISDTGLAGYFATMYYTVRLSKGYHLYTFQGFADKVQGSSGEVPICSTNVRPQWYQVIKPFLNSAVRNDHVYPNAIDWKLKSVNNVGYPESSVGLAFVADIVIAVKE